MILLARMSEIIRLGTQKRNYLVKIVTEFKNKLIHNKNATVLRWLFCMHLLCTVTNL